MRYNLLKKHSTKAERIVYEMLKGLHIPFKHRWLINGREVDFIIRNRIVLEIDGHTQPNSQKNEMLVKEGYTPIHLRNKNIINKRDKLRQWLQISLI